MSETLPGLVGTAMGVVLPGFFVGVKPWGAPDVEPLATSGVEPCVVP